ncbi:MAG: HEAT repeat domain-containing protein [Anaerolineales bacterium]|jgi:HEAT repeat protein
MEPDFEGIIALLRNQDHPFASSHLASLSDLDRDQTERFRSIWSQLPIERRRHLIKEFGKLANDHIEYCFERINRFAIHDPDAAVRRQAIDNLWECEDPKLVPPLLAALTEDTDPKVQAAAGTALSRFVYLGELDQLESKLLTQLEDVLLHTATESPHPEVRIRSLEALGYSSRQEVAPLIMQAYESADEQFQLSALLAMGRSANKQWKPQVYAEMRNPSPALRAQAAWSAGELELIETVPELVDLLGDVDDTVRRAATWALGQVGGKQARRALSDLLDITDDGEESAWIEDALDHLAFVDNTRDFVLLEFDEPEGPSI